MRLPDPIERMEASAERWADENIEGDMFKCGCGKIAKLDEGEVISSNPYASPVCPDCFNEYTKDYFKEQKENNKKKSI